MDVIESLKQSEENQDPAEESSEEHMNGLEENAGLGSGDGEIGKKTENADLKDDSLNPPPDCEPKRTSKRRKVDAAQVAGDENDPSSSLQVQLSDDDFE